MEGDGLVGSYASCDHEVDEEAGMGGVHGVGDEADVEMMANRFMLPR
jgi:hypothetical protein